MPFVTTTSFYLCSFVKMRRKTVDCLAGFSLQSYKCKLLFYLLVLFAYRLLPGMMIHHEIVSDSLTLTRLCWGNLSFEKDAIPLFICTISAAPAAMLLLV